MKSRFIAALLLLALSASGRTRIALFPLENSSNDPLVDWIGYAVPELLFRKLDALAEIQAWDPVLLFQSDTSAWRLDNDSLLQLHALRWKWDIAVGGVFKAGDDSVWIRLRSTKPAAGRIAKKEWKAKGPISSCLDLCSHLAFDLLVSVGYEFSAKDAAMLKEAMGAKMEAYATYARGYGYEMHGEFANALSAYRHAVDLDRSLAQPFLRMGLIYASGRETENARDALERAAALMPQSPPALSAMAEFLLDHGERQKAEAVIDEHRRALEESPAGMRAIGKSFMASGENQRAIAILARALAAGPSDLETDFTLGRAYLSSGQFNEAADVFRRLIDFRPRHTRYYSLLGSTYRQTGRLMESTTVLEMAMRLAPDDVPNLINLSTTYFRIGWYERAEQVLLRARELEPEIGAIYLNLGVVYWHMGKTSEARDMFAEASKRQSSVQSAYNNEANILFLAGDIKNAVKAYKRADKVGKKSEAILYNMGRAYVSLGKPKEAAQCFDEVLLLSPQRIDVLQERARLADELGDEEDAEQYYRKVVQLSPQNKDALTRLVNLLLERGRYEEAAQFVKSALEDFPGDRTLRLMLPAIYAQMGWHEVAIMEYEALVADKDFQTEAQCYLGLGKSCYELIVKKHATHFDKTIAYLKKASELDPSNPEPDMLIGSIYMEYKDYPSLAVEHWKKALGKAGDAATRRTIRNMIVEAGE